MSEIIVNQSARRGRLKKGRNKGPVPHLDMTPMVDLGFLLLTFFVLTSTFSKLAVMPLVFPVESKPTPVKNILTVFINRSDTVHYYFGIMDSITQTPFKTTGYDKMGIRKVLSEHNRIAIDKINTLSKKLLNDKSLSETVREEKFKRESQNIMSDNIALTVIVKTDDHVKYSRVIKVLDETEICGISKKAILDISKEEKLALEKHRQAFSKL